MITTEEMEKACGHNVIIRCNGCEPRHTYIEDYIAADPSEDEEPMILYKPKLAACQSTIISIEILD